MANNYPTAEISNKPRISLIWIIPVTAALIGAWLLFKYYSERGTIITITFNEAAGVEEKKTPIRYKDVQVGKVRKLSLSSDLSKVRVSAEIFPGMAENLGGNTRFWVERPRVTLQGISGLNTLISGVHIGMDPGERSEPLKEYTGLSEPPAITTGAQGTALILRTERLGSVDIGSPVYYRQINVGEVTGYRINKGTDAIDISIYVRAPYDSKIRTNTRFWNASGLDMELTSSGVSIQMESLTSLLIGGVAFETPNFEFGKALSSETVFKLYENYKLAKDDTERLNKLFYVMYFDDTLHGLSEDSLIKFGGVTVGKVESILLETTPENTRIRTLVKVSLRIDKFSPQRDREEAEQTLQNLVSEGMRAQLTVDSLLTGALFISLNLPRPDDIKVPAEPDPGSSEAIEVVTLMPTSQQHTAIFPTTGAQSTLLNFDATEISNELKKAIATVNALLKSRDVQKTLKGLADTSQNISRITGQLDKRGFSGELVNTLKTAQKTADDISKLMSTSRKTMQTIDSATSSLQQDASQSMKTFNNVSNKLQRDASRALQSFDKGLKSTISEDSALQYKLQQLINDLAEAANSFSVLADTIQRKPNSVIFGK